MHQKTTITMWTLSTWVAPGCWPVFASWQASEEHPCRRTTKRLVFLLHRSPGRTSFTISHFLFLKPAGLCSHFWVRHIWDFMLAFCDWFCDLKMRVQCAIRHQLDVLINGLQLPGSAHLAVIPIWFSGAWVFLPANNWLRGFENLTGWCCTTFQPTVGKQILSDFWRVTLSSLKPAINPPVLWPPQWCNQLARFDRGLNLVTMLVRGGSEHPVWKHHSLRATGDEFPRLLALDLCSLHRKVAILHEFMVNILPPKFHVGASLLSSNLQSCRALSCGSAFGY